MGMTEPERHLLMAAWDAKTRTPRSLSEGQLCKVAADIFKDDLAQLTPAFEALLNRGWLALDEAAGTYTLTAVGMELAAKLSMKHRRDAFDLWMTRSAKSAAYAEYCRRVNGMTLIQFNMVDREQLTKLLDTLQLTPRDRVVDLGCGIGTLTEHVSDQTGAHVTGIDFADAAISCASERSQDKRGRLSFQVGDLNSLELPGASFDAALVIDSLYFVEDLDRVVGDILALLRPGGQVGAFFTSIRRRGDEAEILTPERSRLGMALQRHGTRFTAHEFTENERRFWQASRQAANELKGAFEAEGNLRLWESRNREVSTMLNAYESSSARRYLYHVER